MFILEREKIIEALKDKNLSKVARVADISLPSIYRFMDIEKTSSLEIQKKLSDYLHDRIS